MVAFCQSVLLNREWERMRHTSNASVCTLWNIRFSKIRSTESTTTSDPATHYERIERMWITDSGIKTDTISQEDQQQIFTQQPNSCRMDYFYCAPSLRIGLKLQKTRAEELTGANRHANHRPTTSDRRPTTDQRPHIWKISNGHISAICDGERSQRREAPADRFASWWWWYLREGSSDPLHTWFYGGVFEVDRSNGGNSGLTKFNRYVGENNARGVIRLVTIWSISCRILIFHKVVQRRVWSMMMSLHFIVNCISTRVYQ